MDLIYIDTHEIVKQVELHDPVEIFVNGEWVELNVDQPGPCISEKLNIPDETEIYSRLILDLTDVPYISFNSEKVYFSTYELRSFVEKDFRIIQIIEKDGKPFVVYFIASLVEGLERD